MMHVGRRSTSRAMSLLIMISGCIVFRAHCSVGQNRPYGLSMIPILCKCEVNSPVVFN